MKLPLRIARNSARVYDADNEYIMKLEKFSKDSNKDLIDCINNESKAFERPLMYEKGYIQTPSDKILFMGVMINGKYSELARKERAELIIKRIQK